MRRLKGHGSRKIAIEFPELRKRYWSRRFRERAYFYTTSRVVNDETILQYLENHTPKTIDVVR